MTREFMNHANVQKKVHSDFDVEQTLALLTVDEKIALISGSDPWHTAPIRRLGIPSIRLTDGPNGVRGTKFFNGVPAACFPCGACPSQRCLVQLLIDN